MGDVNSTIKMLLASAEEDNKLTILYASESGSRAWGFPSIDSDYDVRFIYIRPREWYLSIERGKDTLSIQTDKVLDLAGWDIQKALHQIGKSNPVPCEWLQSPIVYTANDTIRDDLWDLCESYFSPRKYLHHYLGITRNAMKDVDADSEVKIKKAFYALRPLLAAMWVMERRSIPPMEFRKLLAGTSSTEIEERVVELLDLKKRSDESQTIKIDADLHRLITGYYGTCLEYADTLQDEFKGPDRLNEYFNELLNRA